MTNLSVSNSQWSHWLFSALGFPLATSCTWICRYPAPFLALCFLAAKTLFSAAIVPSALEMAFCLSAHLPVNLCHFPTHSRNLPCPPFLLFCCLRRDRENWNLDWSLSLLRQTVDHSNRQSQVQQRRTIVSLYCCRLAELFPLKVVLTMANILGIQNLRVSVVLFW